MVREGYIYTADTAGSLYGFDSVTYEEQFSIPEPAAFVGGEDVSALAANRLTGSFYVVTDAGQLFQYNSSGSQDWSFAFTGGNKKDDVVVNQTTGSIYTDNIGSLFQFDNSGTVDWSSVTTTSSDILDIDIDDNGSLYTVTLNGSLNRFDNQGNKNLEYRSGSSLRNVGVYNGSIFVYGTNGNKIDIHDNTGSLINSFDVAYTSNEDLDIIKIDSFGSLILASTWFPNISKYSQTGSLLWSLDVEEDGVFDLKLDQENNIYAISQTTEFNPIIYKVSSSGSVIETTEKPSANRFTNIAYFPFTQSIIDSNSVISKTESDIVTSDSTINKLITGSWVSDIISTDIDTINFSANYISGSSLIQYKYLDTSGSSLGSYANVNVGDNTLEPSIGSDFRLELFFSGSYYNGNTSVWDYEVVGTGTLQTKNLGSDVQLSSTKFNRAVFVPSGSFVHLISGSFSTNGGTDWFGVNPNKELTIPSSNAGSEILFRATDGLGSVVLDDISFTVKQDDF